MESDHISLRTLIKYFDNFVSVIGFALNSLLIYLIIYKTSIRMKDYRPILLQNCLIDTCFNTVHTIMKMQVDQKNGNFYMYVIGPVENATTPYNVLFNSLWVFTLFYCLTGVPVQFVYRYLMIVKGIKVTFVHYFTLLLSAFIPAFIYALWNSYTFWPNEEQLQKAAMLLKADSNYRDNMPNFLVASIDQWPLRIQFVYAYFLVCGVYGITIFCNTKVWRHLKAMESQMSIQARDAQKQITVTLIFQAIIPFIFLLIPIFLAVTITFIHANVPGVSLVVPVLYTVIPIANPLLTLIVIKNYRKNLLFVLQKICRRKIKKANPMAKSTMHESTHVAERRIF